MIGRELMQGMWRMMMKPEGWIEKEPSQLIQAREAQEKSLILKSVKQSPELMVLLFLNSKL